MPISPPPKPPPTANTTSPLTPPASPPVEPWGWNRRQRLGLASLLFLLLTCLILQLVRHPYRLSDPLVIQNGEPVSLPQRIDPNTATPQDLAKIPHIGETLATKIVAYRSARQPTAPDAIVFHQLSDLDPIPGIGPKLLDQLAPFLTFPDDPSPPP